MAETIESNVPISSDVSINFDGLLRFAIDDDHHLCRAEVHTAAPGHVMYIKIEKDEQVIDRKIFSVNELKALHPIRIFIGIGDELTPATPDAKDSGDFKNILDLAGANVYKRPRATKAGRYDCSIWLQNGEVGAGDETETKECSRVRQDLFEALKFVWSNQQEWLNFKAGAQAVDKEAIVDLTEGFARNVSATVPLVAGQSLCIKSATTGAHLFSPLIFGPNYDVTIKYADIELPNTLADCKGFAHHSEALDLSGSDPIFGIFRPASFRDSGFIGVRTEPGCCDSARMGDSVNLWNDFQPLQNLRSRNHGGEARY
jgi:hypothetical protein